MRIKILIIAFIIAVVVVVIVIVDIVFKLLDVNEFISKIISTHRAKYFIFD
jgi:hypothetical protein